MTEFSPAPDQVQELDTYYQGLSDVDLCVAAYATLFGESQTGSIGTLLRLVVGERLADDQVAVLREVVSRIAGTLNCVVVDREPSDG